MTEIPRQIRRLMERKQEKIKAKSERCLKCSNPIEHKNQHRLCKKCLYEKGINLKSGALPIY